MRANELPIGTRVIVNCGAYYPVRPGTVIEHLGSSARVQLDRLSEDNPEDSTVIGGSETELGIGWKRLFEHEHKAVKTETVPNSPYVTRTGVRQVETCSCGMTRHVWITSFKVEAGAWQ